MHSAATSRALRLLNSLENFTTAMLDVTGKAFDSHVNRQVLGLAPPGSLLVLPRERYLCEKRAESSFDTARVRSVSRMAA